VVTETHLNRTANQLTVADSGIADGYRDRFARRVKLDHRATATGRRGESIEVDGEPSGEAAFDCEARSLGRTPRRL
jgi:hypothetical protein